MCFVGNSYTTGCFQLSLYKKMSPDFLVGEADINHLAPGFCNNDEAWHRRCSTGL